jgi:hypothetical protein
MTTRTTALLAALALTTAAAAAHATPSTQIWIPSTDTQKFATLHLNYDVYARPDKIPLLVLGPTVGVLPFDGIQAEVGFDLMFQGNHDLDKYPIYFHAKLATPEDGFVKYQPAVAVGIYNVGIHSADFPNNTMQNVGYGELARTFPYLGRLTAGYYFGNGAALRTPVVAGILDATTPDDHGLLLSWDRTMSELTDKLWLCVDYQQGQNQLGAINAGFAWAFTKDISVILAYDHYWNHDIAGADTFTVQLDINLFMPADKPAEPAPVARPADPPKPADKPAGVP